MAPAVATPPDQPLPPPERLDLLDALRGFALFGVVTANALALSGFNPRLHPEYLAAPIDRAVFTVQGLLIGGKFMALFSLLFGVGFGLQLARARQRGTTFIPRYLRRLAALFLIGVAHQSFTDTGDVLRDYALFAAVLILFRNASDRTLLFAAAASLFLPVIARAIIELTGYQRPPIADPEYVERIMAEGPYLEKVWLRFNGLSRSWWGLVRNTIANLSLFFLGFYVARRNVIDAPGIHTRWLRGVLLVMVVITVFGQLARPLAERIVSGAFWQALVPMLVETVRVFAQGIAYGIAFILLWQLAPWWRRLAVPLRYAGRMALTNYLSVSVLGTIVFFGLGLAGSLRPSVAVAFGVLLWVTQLVWSRWWLGRHAFGPAEWVWRRLTYGSVNPVPLPAQKDLGLGT